MHTLRKIVEIDEEKCDGCGQCILACAEGAIQIIDGKARLVSDVYCDGLGDCIGDCPQGALRIIEREAQEFDEGAVEQRLSVLARPQREEVAQGCPGAATAPAGCPGMMSLTLERTKPEAEDTEADDLSSELTHWPIKLQLLGPSAPFLKGADLVLLADCAAAAFPGLHRKLLRGRAVAMGCPKLDDLEAHIDRLAEILKTAQLRSLTVVHMEVPCCHGFAFAAEQAIERSGASVPVERMIISRTGEILAEERVSG